MSILCHAEHQYHIQAVESQRGKGRGDNECARACIGGWGGGQRKHRCTASEYVRDMCRADRPVEYYEGGMEIKKVGGGGCQ